MVPVLYHESSIMKDARQLSDECRKHPIFRFGMLCVHTCWKLNESLENISKCGRLEGFSSDCNTSTRTASGDDKVLISGSTDVSDCCLGVCHALQRKHTVVVVEQ
ncbi:hypothetical protein FisN_29Lu042 [Fistulifera solaris]|uniref:Uncharacterized protein n=1 Tax=Fistulifera solaris TaxID=1519565 RepID=A0A1Z5JLD2_FISSO|nr:hypothetical protein FisN_29Lu042 [Fistulifera solaris]|eukprot:GAX14823.1 hypothetical protein FisN_29Lu042 [Fistulifera solaris]